MNLSELGLDRKDISALNRKHVYTVDDLVRRFPRDYRDYRRVINASGCRNGEYCAVYGAMTGSDVKEGAKMRYLRLNFVSPDGTRFRTDFFVGKYAAYLQRQYSRYVGYNVIVTGKASVDPTYGISVSGAEVAYAYEFIPGIYPVYPKNGNMKEETFRFWVKKALQMHGEILEPELRARFSLDTYRHALESVHNPASFEALAAAQQQMVFYDLLWFELKRRSLESGKPDTTSAVFSSNKEMLAFIESLPFGLTKLSAQEKTAAEAGCGGQAEIIDILSREASSGKRIEAVIEGDVGCGKTAVAGVLAILAASNGYQTVIMAPKTVLAQQHAKDISDWCSRAGYRCAAIIGTPKTAAERKERKEILKEISSGNIDVIVGTHAVFGKDVSYARAGLVIIDEEQQFGVEQKAALRQKAMPDAHYLEMSATPVPRSLALAIYGNREVLKIIKKPEGRRPIRTQACPSEEPAMRFVRKQLEAGRQCYVVVPMIEENETDGIDGVKKTAEKYREYFKEYSVEAVDGRMKEEDFTKSITRFKEGHADILVSTTVVEVGVNVPNATVMVVVNAERFGLSQLHQLRGRVGRWKFDSYCILLTNNRDNERIKVMETTDDGFAIAEKDLALRGSGDINGVRQSGQDKYVTEALMFPEVHRKAKEAAAMCNEQNRYSVFLEAVYREHESLDEK